MTGVLLRPLLGGAPFDSDDLAPLSGVDGSALAEVRTAPKLLVQLALRRLVPAGVPPEIFAAAGRLFADGAPAGETPGEYCRRAALATGLPAGVFRAGLSTIRDGLGALAAARAAELPVPAPDVRWVPKGRTLAVIAASNHPEPHLLWARALSLGYAVAVRPGSRDPFTPARLAAALLAAGLPPAALAVLPTERDAVEPLVRAADLAVVYGGPDAVSRWRGDARVLVRGPGSSKVLLDTPLTDELVEYLARAVSAEGGTRCTNISVIRTGQDVAEVADRLAARLAGLAARPVLAPDARLPVFDPARAAAIAARLDRLRDEGFRAHTGAERLVTLADGSVAALPVVLSAPDPGHPSIGVELPFPFVIVAGWSPADGLAPLRDSLVLAILADDESLIDAAVREPSVRKVVTGPVDPWTSGPGLPHDGSLAAFLLEPKALIRADGGRS